MAKHKKENQCIHCANELYRRGLCKAHYAKFRRDRDKAIAVGLDPQEFDDLAVERGVLLPDLRASDKNPFDAILTELRNRRAKKTDTPRKKAE